MYIVSSCCFFLAHVAGRHFLHHSNKIYIIISTLNGTNRHLSVLFWLFAKKRVILLEKYIVNMLYSSTRLSKLFECTPSLFAETNMIRNI